MLETGNVSSPIETARNLVRQYGHAATCWQILNPALSLWFTAAGDGVVGYTTYRRVRVVAGDPVCPAERLAEVAQAFELDAARSRQRVCYLACERPLVTRLLLTGHHAAVTIGAQPTWHPAALKTVFQKVADLRYQRNRARNKGVSVAERSAGGGHHPELKSCLEQWLEAKPLPVLGFMTDPYLLPHMEGRRLWVAEQKGVPAGYAVLSPVPARRGWLVEQIVRCPEAPNGTAESLVAAVTRQVCAEGSRFITLGAAPLSRRGAQLAERPPWWFRAIAGWMRAHGTRFYNFRGLEHFKAKFRPQAWEPVFAVAAEPRLRPATFYAVMGTFTGRSPLVTAGQSAALGLLTEIRRRPRQLSHRAP